MKQINQEQYRTAVVEDIPALHRIRVAVKENVLSDPSRITAKDYETFLLLKGKGWVCETDGIIKGFAIIDVSEKNIWALFVDPLWEGRGIGSTLHDMMLDDYFSKFSDTLWLGTEPGTRAEKFYRRKGWQEAGIHGINEIKFEMGLNNWKSV